jgi:beta-N-acetylhexosaminidase
MVTGRPFIAIDQEGGYVQRMDGDGTSDIPTALEQGSWSTETLRASATTWARELSEAGISVNLAPVADTVPSAQAASNGPIGYWDRQFGEDPRSVGEHVAAFVGGMSEGGILSTLKHFPGLGQVTGNTDFGREGTYDTVTSRTHPALQAFSLGIAASPSLVMISHATYTLIDPDHQAVFSSVVIDDLLRDQLGWTGVVMADSMTAEAVTGIPPGQRAVDFIAAGGDLMSFGIESDIEAALEALVDQMQQSDSFRARVDMSVMRILLAKSRAGLIDLSSAPPER